MKAQDEPQQCQPWINCNRETKLKSFGMLPALLRIIAEEGMSLCQHVEETNKVVNELTAAIDDD